MNEITRAKIIDLFRENNMPISAQNLSVLAIYSEDAAFLTSILGAQTPVEKIHDHLIGTGQTDHVTGRLRQLYQALVGAQQRNLSQ